MKIEVNKIMNPAFLLGTAFNIAYWHRKYHSGTICKGVSNPQTSNALSGCEKEEIPKWVWRRYRQRIRMPDRLIGKLQIGNDSQKPMAVSLSMDYGHRHGFLRGIRNWQAYGRRKDIISVSAKGFLNTPKKNPMKINPGIV